MILANIPGAPRAYWGPWPIIASRTLAQVDRDEADLRLENRAEQFPETATNSVTMELAHG